MMFWSFVVVKFKVRQLYPIREHSYCQCDRNLGAYSNVLRRTARMATATDYDEIISIKSGLIHGYGLLKNWSTSLLDYITQYKNIASRKLPSRIQSRKLPSKFSSTVGSSRIHQELFQLPPPTSGYSFRSTFLWWGG